MFTVELEYPAFMCKMLFSDEVILFFSFLVFFVDFCLLLFFLSHLSEFLEGREGCALIQLL